MPKAVINGAQWRKESMQSTLKFGNKGFVAVR